MADNDKDGLDDATGQLVDDILDLDDPEQVAAADEAFRNTPVDLDDPVTASLQDGAFIDRVGRDVPFRDVYFPVQNRPQEIPTEDPGTLELPLPESLRAPELASEEERREFRNAEAAAAAKDLADAQNFLASRQEGLTQEQLNQQSSGVIRAAKNRGQSVQEMLADLSQIRGPGIAEPELDPTESKIRDIALTPQTGTAQLPGGPASRVDQDPPLALGGFDFSQIGAGPRGPVAPRVDIKEKTTAAGDITSQQEAERRALLLMQAQAQDSYRRGLSEQGKLTEDEIRGVEQELADFDPIGRNQIVNTALESNRRRQESLNAELQDVMRQSVDPNRIFSNGNGVSAALAIAAGALSQTLGGPGSVNTALSIINNAIENDLRAQVSDLANKRQVGRLRGQVLSSIDRTLQLERGGIDKIRQLYYRQVQDAMAKFKARTSSLGAKQAADQVLIDIRRKELESDIKARREGLKREITTESKGRNIPKTAAAVSQAQALTQAGGAVPQPAGAPAAQPPAARRAPLKGGDVRRVRKARPRVSRKPAGAEATLARQIKSLGGSRDVTPDLIKGMSRKGFDIARPGKFAQTLGSKDAGKRNKAEEAREELELKALKQGRKVRSLFQIRRTADKLLSVLEKRPGGAALTSDTVLSQVADKEASALIKRLRRMTNEALVPLGAEGKSAIGGQFTDKDLEITTTSLGKLSEDKALTTVQDVKEAIGSINRGIPKAFADISDQYRVKFGLDWNTQDPRIIGAIIKDSASAK